MEKLLEKNKELFETLKKLEEKILIAKILTERIKNG